MNKPVLILLPLIAIIGSARAQSLPIVFVTQVPPTATVNTVTSIGNNHLPSVKAAPRGGDLMIRYGDGSMRFLTREAGFGSATTTQGPGAIAVRDPAIHWSGQRILFSMVVSGADPAADRWQMYEATGIAQGSTVQITKVPNQPANFNNVQPCYAPDDRIIYVSDRTLDGTTATYPAIDEKGQGAINTGLWSLSPQTGDLMHLEHSPSGSFDPAVDSYGRVLFTRWDHLQRDTKSETAPGTVFDFTSESSSATYQAGVFTESFPEPVSSGGLENGHQFDLFMPWTVNTDGTELVTLNHVGRQEFSPVATRSRADANLQDMMVSTTNTTTLRVGSLMQLTEDPVARGRYLGTDASMTALSAGRIVSIPDGKPTTNPSTMRISLVTGNGILRDPSVLVSSGRLVASVASGPNLSTSSYNAGNQIPAMPPVIDPGSTLPVDNPFLIRLSDTPVNSQITNSGFSTVLVSLPPATTVNYDNGETKTFTGKLWQLQPVEVRPTARPAAAVSKMEAPEQNVFISTGVSPLAFKSWMRSRDLALMTVRNVTQRDAADHQQPTNLSVQGGVSTVKADGGPTYSIKALQLLQGEYLRGYSTDGLSAAPGRRIKATAPRYADSSLKPATAGSPEASAKVSLDGSVAALVPAKRATSWQLLDHANSPVVRERYWLSFQAGEIRSCTSCHGVNTTDQASRPVATNSPEALRALLETVKASAPEIAGASAFQVWSESNYGVSLNAAEDDDGDGTANMLEWGMGTSPVSAADKPATPLTVTILNMVDDKYASIAFSHSLTESRAVTILETSSDLATWRTVTSMSAAVTTMNPAYALSRVTGSGGKSEKVTLTSGLPLRQTQDRYYRLRVSMN